MKENTYICQTCNGSIRTRNDDVGTTPFILKCRATEGCNGPMHSQFGRVNPKQTITHEWYLRQDYHRMTLAEYDHARKGGAFIRQIAEVPKKMGQDLTPPETLKPRPKNPSLLRKTMWRREK